jgi:AraC family transcriptional regulator, positive regulator of tynA and feaB
MRQRCVVSMEESSTAGSLPAWEEALSNCVGRMPTQLRSQELTRCEPGGRRTFSGCIEHGDLGGAALCRMAASPFRFSRSLQCGASPAASPLMLSLQLKGYSHYEQQGLRGTLAPGDWCLLDARLPFSWSSLSDCEQIILTPPRPVDAGLNELIERGLALRCDGKTGAGRMVHTLLNEAFDQLEQLAPYSARSMVDAVATFAWNALQEQLDAAPSCAPSDARCARLKAYIDSRLAEPDLSVESIARGCGVSPRSLHRAFALDPAGSVSRHIWQRRLDLSAAALRDPDAARRSITDIALSCGFSSSSHFSRAFRRARGVSPRAYRAAGEQNPRTIAADTGFAASSRLDALRR